MQVDILRMVTDWLTLDVNARIATVPVDPGEAQPPLIGTWAPGTKNLLLWSEDLTQAATWATTHASITSNALLAPDGNVTGDKLVEDATLNNHFVGGQAGSAVVAGGLVAGSVFVHAGERTNVYIAISDRNNFTGISNANSFAVSVDLNAATFSNPTTTGVGTIVGQSVSGAPNGWRRISLVGTLGPSATSAWIVVVLTNTSGVSSYTGDGSSGAYVWGAQIEQGAVGQPMGAYARSAGAVGTQSIAVFDETRGEYAANFKEPPVYPALYAYCRSPVVFEGEPTPDGQIRKSKSPVPVVLLYMTENSTKQDAIRDCERTLRAIGRSLRELSRNANESARIRNGIIIVLGEGPQVFDPAVSAIGKSKVNGAVSVGYYVRDFRPSY